MELVLSYYYVGRILFGELKESGKRLWQLEMRGRKKQRAKFFTHAAWSHISNSKFGNRASNSEPISRSEASSDAEQSRI